MKRRRRDSKKLQKNLEIETKTGRLQNLRILFTDWDLITHLKRVFFFWCLANSFGSNAYFAPHRFCSNCSSFFSRSALPLFCIPSAFRTLLLLLTFKKCLKKIVSSKIWWKKQMPLWDCVCHWAALGFRAAGPRPCIVCLTNWQSARACTSVNLIDLANTKTNKLLCFFFSSGTLCFCGREHTWTLK